MVVESLIGVIAPHLDRSRVRMNVEMVHNEVVRAVSPVVVDIASNAKGLGPLQIEACRAEQTTYGRSAYPYKADFDS